MLRLRRAQPTETSRAEAFSDGVFAVAITLLALDLSHIHADPAYGNGSLFAAMRELWPTLLAFAASFMFIGVAWSNHHNIFVRVNRLSRGLNAANLLLLAGITMVPWATSTLAEALSRDVGHHGQQEVLLYASVTMLGAISWWLVFHTLARNPDLLKDPRHAHGFAVDQMTSIVGVLGSVVPAAIGYFWSPIAATAVFFALPVFFAVTSEGFERVRMSNESRPSESPTYEVPAGSSAGDSESTPEVEVEYLPTAHAKPN